MRSAAGGTELHKSAGSSDVQFGLFTWQPLTQKTILDENGCGTNKNAKVRAKDAEIDFPSEGPGHVGLRQKPHWSEVARIRLSV